MIIEIKTKKKGEKMNRDKLKIIVAMFIFGTIGLVRRFIPYSSGMVAFSRAFIGVLFLLLIHIIQRKKISFVALRENLLALSISGALLGFNWILLFEAYRYTTVAVATICYYMAPIIIILVAPILFHEKLTLKKGICAGIAIMGMILVSGVLQTGFIGIKGVLFGLGAAIMYATIVILNKKIKNIEANDRTIFQLGIAAVVLCPYVIFTERGTSLEVNAVAIIMLCIAGILHTGIAYALYFGSISKVPAQTAALFSYIDPVVAVLLSALFLQEGLTFISFIGIVMVIGSALFSEKVN